MSTRTLQTAVSMNDLPADLQAELTPTGFPLGPSDVGAVIDRTVNPLLADSSVKPLGFKYRIFRMHPVVSPVYDPRSQRAAAPQLPTAGPTSPGGGLTRYATTMTKWTNLDGEERLDVNFDMKSD